MSDTSRPERQNGHEVWRDLSRLAHDFLFETDAAGHFVALEPGAVLGWNAASLVGRPAEELLTDPAAFDPFRAAAPVRRRRVALRQADGATATMLVSATPAPGGGVRGVAQDVTRQEGRDATVAADRKRAEALLKAIEQMRMESAPARRILGLLDGIVAALGLEGVAVAEVLGRHYPPLMRHRAGTGGPDVAGLALAVLDPDEPDAAQAMGANARPLLACPLVTRFGERIALAAWRPEGGAPFTPAGLELAGMACAVLGAALEHESIQREMARQIRNDPLTGLLNRRAFLDEALRRIDRLDREGQSGTLMLIDLDDFAPLGRLNAEAGEEALCMMARILRAAVRPADLVARLGGGGFAAWMDGADELTGAERAEMLRGQVPAELAHLAGNPEAPLTISIGIACRRPSRGEELDSLMRRAGLALEEAKHGGWRVSHDDPQ